MMKGIIILMPNNKANQISVLFSQTSLS